METLSFYIFCNLFFEKLNSKALFHISSSFVNMSFRKNSGGINVFLKSIGE